MNLRINLAPDSFVGQVIYVGMDVHKKSWKVTLIMNDLNLKTFSCDPDVLSLVKSLKNTFPGASYEFCYEAGFCGFWICRELQKFGYKCIVVNPADVSQSQKEKLFKSDSVDSQKLARELSHHNLTPIYIPSELEESIRDLFRTRSSLVKDLTRVKNRIKAFLLRYNITSPLLNKKSWSMKFIKWLKQVDFSQSTSKIAFNHYIKNLEVLKQDIKFVEAEILETINSNNKTNSIYTHLITIPGIGKISAIALISELYNMKRFDNDDKLLNYVGLIPTTKNSGEKERSRGVTFRHNKRLRIIIIESSWIAIKNDPALLLAYNKLCRRMKGTNAIVRIAKKLTRRIRSIWLTGQNYKLGVIQ